jgi:hypothetical protein
MEKENAQGHSPAFPYSAAVHDEDQIEEAPTRYYSTRALAVISQLHQTRSYVVRNHDAGRATDKRRRPNG